MDLGSLLLGLALLLIVAFIIAQPIIERQGVRERRVTPADRLRAEYEDLLAELRDLEFDHATGKINAEDFALLRAQLVARGADVLKQLETYGPADDEIERAIASRRRARAERKGGGEAETAAAARRGNADQARRGADGGEVTCPHCGAVARPGDQFCARCGARLQPVEAAG
jgi:hypothetical protein